LLQQFDQIEAQLGVTIQSLLFAMGVAVLVTGAIFGLLAFWVRRGGIAAAITSLLFVILPLLFTGFVVIAGLVQVFTGAPQALAAVAMYGLPLALLILLAVWLIQAAKNSARLTAISQQGTHSTGRVSNSDSTTNSPAPAGRRSRGDDGRGIQGTGRAPALWATAQQQGWHAPPPPPRAGHPAGDMDTRSSSRLRAGLGGARSGDGSGPRG
jgi:hypothetical protein